MRELQDLPDQRIEPLRLELDAIELRFNLQGAVELAKSSAGAVAPEQISAIRERAQLLRSHALAQKNNHNHY